ncbi:MAG: hypothetical protein HC782_03500 [Gammaproteobacteria bacterium]|nr:hypothetical protein [Gammaproteobacteria bacterium]
MNTKPRSPISGITNAVSATLALTIAHVAHNAVAQSVPKASSASQAARLEDKKNETIIVVGNPLGATDARDVVLPVEVLTGNALLLKRANTLGETVDGLLGVTSTWFGPNAGRPVIRGLDGDRIKVLTNLGASFDASALSLTIIQPLIRSPLSV